MLNDKMIYSCSMERDFNEGESHEDFTLRVNRRLNGIGLSDIISINYINESKVILTYRKKSIVSLIVAKSKNNVIGKEGKIPWHCSEDMKLFKETTMGNIVIMGRKTFESMGNKSLPKRENFVISHKPITCKGIKYSPDLESAINEARLTGEDKEVFIIGGASLYNEALNKDLIHRLYITTINLEIQNGDTFFPEFKDVDDGLMYKSQFYKEKPEKIKSTEFTFKKYVRRFFD